MKINRRAIAVTMAATAAIGGLGGLGAAQRAINRVPIQQTSFQARLRPGRPSGTGL
jgi:hypothetical protein